MGVKIAPYTSPFLQWAAHPSSSSPSRAISSRRRHDGRFVPQRLNRSSLFGTPLHRSKSRELSKPTKTQSFRRVSSASFSDEEFSKKIQELTLRFNDERDANLSSSIEMKANSVHLPPLSLRIINKKRQCEEGVKQSARDSMSKAFSSMVFMIQELQSFTLHMRETLFYEDLRGILVRVREEMHASFVWLFRQVFSATPTLMVYVMILLANFTVYSLGTNSALAAAAAAPTTTTTVTEVTTVGETNEKFDKTFSVSSPTVDGNNNNNGGGGNIRPVLSGTDGDGFDVPEGPSQLSSSTFGSTATTETETSVSGKDEVRLWNSIVEEAEQMQFSKIDNVLDHETRKRFVSPLDARVEAGEYIDYFRTELHYQTGLSQEPDNPLLLANYAQFLYIVSDDYDRAEEYFKRAVGVEPKDAEALSKYATFLWRARDDLWAAEEIFLEAIDADPTNSFYAANYANFLWNTGGDETCFPLDESHEDTI
ncbi:Tetratricopeptide repeat (TPR)-like superfamily protein [Raphanus sativus]|uniref:Uncharacterized protein LOC108813436 n=1 Tax=Raphanus sativus TaxID=3726 RepID=A0A6J0K3A0_RAPSA|nr:uncharacterized protein LOC108813436 [Raphanus sativus]KAJ4891275.1 Tetratricopeptide repeat (TPR)-like superfamily protein [Raphanus sativus]